MLSAGQILRSVFVLLLVFSVATLVTGDSIQPAKAEIQSERGLLQPGNVTNNSTVQHRNPEDLNERGNRSQIRIHLSGKMTELLSGSVYNISQGQYQRAQSALGDDYDQYLEKYVNVSGEVDSVEESKTASTLNETRTIQREYVQTLEAYNETYQAYQAAKSRGNETRARQLARRLDRLSGELQTQKNDLIISYRILSNTTGVSTSEEQQTIATITSNRVEQTQTIVQSEFIDTRLTIESRDTTASFDNALTLTGSLTTIEGEPISGIITLRAGTVTKRISVDSNGSFTTAWRPLLVRTGAQNVTIEYIPGSATPYLGTRTNVSVLISQVTPSIAVERQPDSASYSDEVIVSGNVSVNGTDVGHLPLQLRIGSQTVGTTATDGDGSYNVSFQVPANVASGNRTLHVAAPFQDRAIADTPGTATLLVEKSETNLQVTTKWSDGTLHVEGKLTTADGDPVRSQEVRLTTRNSTIAVVTTTDRGTYRTTIEADKASSVEKVTARFDGAGTNLESTKAQAAVTRPEDKNQAESKESSSGVYGIPSRELVSIAGIGTLALAVLAVTFRRYNRTPSAITESEQSEVEQSSTTSASEESVEPEPVPELVQASEQLSQDSDLAVELAYNGVRRELGTDDERSTHWEFFDSTAATLSESAQSDLRVLTERYELAAFAPDSISPAKASEAVEAASRLLVDDPDD